MPRLIGHSSEINGQAFDLTEPKVTIGRTPDNKIHIPDNSISSHHAELSLEGDDYSVRDLGSTNGTRVNGEKVATSNLRRGDLLRIGNVELTYESEVEPVSISLPEIHRGLSLEQSVSRGRPAHFIPFAGGTRSSEKEKVPWKLLIALAAVLAVGGAGYLAFVLATSSGPTP